MEETGGVAGVEDVERGRGAVEGPEGSAHEGGSTSCRKEKNGLESLSIQLLYETIQVDKGISVLIMTFDPPSLR